MTSRFDLRKHSRISPIVIRAEYQKGGRGHFQEGYLLNVSQGGAFLATSERLDVEEKLTLRILLPWGLGDIPAEAKVVWCSDRIGQDKEVPAGVGLCFTKLSPEAGEKLQHYIGRFARLAAQIG